MVIALCGTEFEYEMCVSKGKGDTILFLHGWGGDLKSFAGAYRAVCDWGMTCINLAFPKTVPPDWGVYDYADCVCEFLRKSNIDNPIVVGHSFGGRIAIILAARHLCKKVVLVDSAGLKPRLGIKKKIKIAAYRRRVKYGKSLDGFGSIDYNNIDKAMRGVFVRIVNSHLDGLLLNIDCKTLIFWGKQDRDTPMYMARRLRHGIKNSVLIAVDGGHYAYIDAQYRFLYELKNFVTD